MYHVDCTCGNRITVELFQAGASVRCPRCHGTVTVPNSVKLRESAGDRHPGASTLQRVEIALKSKEHPFDGRCIRCSESQADLQVPIRFTFLSERHMSDDGGIGIGHQGLGLKVGSAIEEWRTVHFPLNFCECCYDDFQREWTHARWKQFGGTALIFLILAPMVVLAALFALVMPLISVPALLLILLMGGRHLTRKKSNRFLLAELQRIPLISPMIAEEDEYQIQAGVAIRNH